MLDFTGDGIQPHLAAYASGMKQALAPLWTMDLCFDEFLVWIMIAYRKVTRPSYSVRAN